MKRQIIRKTGGTREKEISGEERKGRNRERRKEGIQDPLHWNLGVRSI